MAKKQKSSRVFRSLRDLQVHYQAIVESEGKPSEKSLSWISSQVPLLADKRIQIYRTAWWIRLRDNLQDDYRHLARCLGEDAFGRLARDYLTAFSSTSYSIAHLGDQLPEFLDRWQHIRKKSWMIDLARLERALYQSFSARDAKPWDETSFMALSSDDAARVQLRMQPAAVLIRTSWKLEAVLSNQSQFCPRGLRYFLVYRDQMSPTWRRLTATQYRFLERVAKDRGTLGCLASMAGRSPWLQWLGEWTLSGVISPRIAP